MLDKVFLFFSQTVVDLTCLVLRENKFLDIENIFKVLFIEYLVSVIMLKKFYSLGKKMTIDF